jgi:hypothetical protein
MPSIEIVCVGQRWPLDLPELPFAVQSEPERRSHRSPEPRWQADFDSLDGWIYHLGNPDLRYRSDAMFFFAYELLSERSRHEANGLLAFDPEFRGALEWLLDRLITVSLVRRIVFTSDWQFGPQASTRGRYQTLPDFWRAHDNGGLRVNALYDIGGLTV